MRDRKITLRRAITIAMVAIATIALAAAGAVVYLTQRLHDAAMTSSSAVETVYSAEETEIALLLHSRSIDPLIREGLETSLRSHLAGVRSSVLDGKERALVDSVEDTLSQYLAEDAVVPDVRMERAARSFAALEALVEYNIASSRESVRRAQGWGVLGDVIGLATAALLVLVTGGVLWWLRQHAFRPLWTLANTMQQFGRGERTVRAEEAGPVELREMSRSFNEMADALAAQRQAQAAFLGGVAHDLRTPLAALNLATEVIAPELPLPPEQRIRSTFQIVQRQIARFDRMIGDFLDMAKIEAGELGLRREDMDLRALVRNVLAFFGDQPRHRINVTMPDAPVMVWCDGLRIEQVITNLVSNAIKYSPDGGDIDVIVGTSGDETVLEVIDRGIGMSEADQARLFEPFRRATRSKETAPGTGLGLYVVRRIVAAHGGRIEVESIIGHGSDFRVILPLALARDYKTQQSVSPTVSAR